MDTGKRMDRILCDLGGPVLVGQESVRSVDQLVNNRDYAQLDPARVNRIPNWVRIRDTDGNDFGMGDLAVVERNCDNGHIAVSDSEVSRLLSRPLADAAYTLEGNNPRFRGS